MASSKQTYEADKAEVQTRVMQRAPTFDWGTPEMFGDLSDRIYDAIETEWREGIEISEWANRIVARLGW